MGNYEQARENYKEFGVDTDLAIKALLKIKISMNCWQGDDIVGFDGGRPLSGGIQVTGNYPGRARNPEELMADMDKAFSLIPGKHKVNLHAIYPLFPAGVSVDRDKLEPSCFKAWTDYAKDRGLGLDFNPTYFSHPKASGFTLASPDPATRLFWVDHGKVCLRITDFFAAETGQESLMNVWVPDGCKDIPGDRTGPRMRLLDSMDQIIKEPHDAEKAFVSLESKVFGIGVESYTVGSGELALLYAASRGIVPLLDNGHYHPTEMVSDKIPAVMLFFDRMALHVTRPVRWDSDHVIRFDDETREIAKEVIAAGPERFFIGTDYFDGSINRVAAWVIGMRNLQKSLLMALLIPSKRFCELQDEGKLTELFVQQEEFKTMPFGAVWDQLCREAEVPESRDWYKEIETYEKDVLRKRG